MRAPLPRPPNGHTRSEHYGFVVRVLTRPELRRWLGRSLPTRYVAGPGIDDAVRVAGRLVASGRRVALEHTAADPADDEAELSVLIDRVHAAGLAPDCDLTLATGRLGAARASSLAAAASAAGLGIALNGPAADVDPLAAGLSDAAVVVPTRDPGAEERCRARAGGRVWLADGRGAAADLAFVRCLNVLMAGAGRPGVATTDPRLIAIAGERAAWNQRSADSWEHVMPCGIRTDEQRRLVAAGYRVRVTVPSGTGALAAVARRLGGRS
jgi:proline dehydrogenase